MARLPLGAERIFQPRRSGRILLAVLTSRISSAKTYFPGPLLRSVVRQAETTIFGHNNGISGMRSRALTGANNLAEVAIFIKIGKMPSEYD